MFNTLIESKPQKQKTFGGTVLSVVLHAGLFALAVAVTANAGQQLREEKRQEDVNFVEVKKEPPPPEPEVWAAAARAWGNALLCIRMPSTYTIG